MAVALLGELVHARPIWLQLTLRIDVINLLGIVIIIVVLIRSFPVGSGSASLRYSQILHALVVVVLQILRTESAVLYFDGLGCAKLIAKFEVADGVGCHTPRHLRLNLGDAPMLAGGLKRCSIYP